MRLAVLAFAVFAQLLLGGCGADNAGSDATAWSQSKGEMAEPATSVSPSNGAPEPGETEETAAPDEPAYDEVDAELMCLSFQALQEMTSVGGLSASEMMSIPEFASQVRMLSSFGTKFPVPEINAASAVTVASVQSTGTMDVEASRVLGEFCAAYPMK